MPADSFQLCFQPMAFCKGFGLGFLTCNGFELLICKGLGICNGSPGLWTHDCRILIGQSMFCVAVTCLRTICPADCAVGQNKRVHVQALADD